MDMYDFHARQGVAALGQESPQRTSGRAPEERSRREACAGYLRAAIRLEEELRRQERNIAAEAVARGIPFKVIGHALDIGKSAAHKAYSGLTHSRPGPSCLSPEWCEERGETGIARRLVRRTLFVTHVGTPRSLFRPTQEWIGILACLKAARLLRRSTESTVRELVAEMRALGATWRSIGENLGAEVTAAQKRYGAGLPDSRHDELRREREAAELLFDGQATLDRAGSEEIHPSVALNYAVDILKRARAHCVEYGSFLQELMASGGPRPGQVDDLSWVDRSAHGIAQAVTALLEPGVLDAALLVAQAFDKAVERDRIEYTPLVLYVFFLFSLSFVHASEKFRICMSLRPGEGTPDDVEACVNAVINGVGVAGMALDVMETLQIQNLFSPGAPTVLTEVLRGERRVY